MTNRLTDAELDALEDTAADAHYMGGDAQVLGEGALALLAEVREHRRREAAAGIEFGHECDESRAMGEPNPWPAGETCRNVTVLVRRAAVPAGPWEPVPTEGETT